LLFCFELGDFESLGTGGSILSPLRAFIRKWLYSNTTVEGIYDVTDMKSEKCLYENKHNHVREMSKDFPENGNGCSCRVLEC
jgi:hypothetical protein